MFNCVSHLERSARSIIGLYPDKYCVKSCGKTLSFSWNTSFSAIWNNLLKDFQYLPLVNTCQPLLTIPVSNPRPQLVIYATHFVWIGILSSSINRYLVAEKNIGPDLAIMIIKWWNMRNAYHTCTIRNNNYIKLSKKIAQICSVVELSGSHKLTTYFQDFWFIHTFIWVY